MGVCIICGKPPTLKRPLRSAHKKGIRKLLTASILRGDKAHEKTLRGADDRVSIHRECFQSYRNQRTLERIDRRKAFLQDIELPQTSSSQFPNVKDFNFTTQCFICARTITNDSDNGQGMIVHDVKTFPELKNAILPYLETRCDQHSQSIIERMGMVSDNDGVGAKYHRQCIIQLTDSSYKRLNPCIGVDNTIESIYSYLASSPNRLFKISELIDQIPGDCRPDLFTVKSRLEEKYGHEIRIFDYQGDDAFVSVRETARRNLPQTPSEERKDSKEVRLDVVRDAAAIILEDIQTLTGGTRAYPRLEDFMKDVDKVVPESLRLFISEVVMKRKRGSFHEWERKCTAIAHAIIAAARPKTFFSTLQMGVAGFFYKKIDSRHLIDLLSALGFCSTYDEVVAFEFSCNLKDKPTVLDRGFSQLGSSNLDFDANPCNRHATVHEIGEIHYLAPSFVSQLKSPKPRILKTQSESASRRTRTVSIVDNAKPSLVPAKPKSHSTQNTLVANLDHVRLIDHTIKPTVDDFIWLYAKQSHVPNVSLWTKFVEEKKTNENLVTSKILCVNSPLSNNNTIRNVLISSVEKCNAAKQISCVLTFDLHLYTRAYEIIDNADQTSPIKNVILRLDGFHLITSFLGSIGYIMAGSGLEDLFRIIFCTDNVKNIMSGDVFSKAIQGHVLIHLILAKKIMNSIELTDDEHKKIDSIIGDTEESNVLTMIDRIAVQAITDKFGDESQKIEARGPTAKLWIQYFRMVTLVKQFIEAERSGNWGLHLDTMQKMLPYFHASGKFLYAKAAHVYIQDMVKLEEKLPTREYKQLINNGHYTIRRTHIFWSSIISDVSIEQLFIRGMKMAGVAAQGRVIFESVLTTWTMGLIFLQKVCEQVENFCGVSDVSTKQNVDMQKSGIFSEDNSVKKIDKWFVEHPPFPEGTELRSISTGIVGDSSINCHLSREIGARMISRLIGLSFHSSTPKPTERVLPLLTVTTGIKIDTVLVPIDPLLIFQRICIVKEAQKDLKTELMYELAPYPLTLFTERGMRKDKKLSMYDCFSPLPNDCRHWVNTVEVVDGGYLLRHVGWDINVPFSDICKKYAKYVRDNFHVAASIIFNGYHDNVNNSGPEDAGRSDEILSAETVVNEKTICVVPQNEFLANKGNMAIFINMLKIELNETGYFVEQATADAGTLIVHRAIQISQKFHSVIIVSEDVDILVMLTGLKHRAKNIHFRRPVNGSIPAQIYSPKNFKYGRTVRDSILFLHAISGCKTTSAVCDMEKDKFLSTLQKHKKLHAVTELFKRETIDPNAIAEAGERFFIALYGGSETENSINALRFKLFGELAKNNKLSPTALPPTRGALRQHSLRTYHQVQSWLGVNHNPEQWGWKKTSYGFQPVRNTMIPVSTNMLRLISCRCRNNCETDCGCRKAGLKCSIICSNCSGHACENQPNVIDILKDNDNDINVEKSAEIHGQNAAEEYEVVEDRVTEIEEDQPTSSKKMRRE